MGTFIIKLYRLLKSKGLFPVPIFIYLYISDQGYDLLFVQTFISLQIYDRGSNFFSPVKNRSQRNLNAASGFYNLFQFFSYLLCTLKIYLNKNISRIMLSTAIYLTKVSELFEHQYSRYIKIIFQSNNLNFKA